MHQRPKIPELNQGLLLINVSVKKCVHAEQSKSIFIKYSRSHFLPQPCIDIVSSLIGVLYVNSVTISLTCYAFTRYLFHFILRVIPYEEAALTVMKRQYMRRKKIIQQA